MTVKHSKKRSLSTNLNETLKPEVEMTEEGQKDAFEDGALPHLDSLYNYARSISNTRSDAEDMVHVTYVRAHSTSNQYTEDTSFKTWLFTILRNLYNTRYKQHGASSGERYNNTEERIYEPVANEDLLPVIKNSEEEFFQNISSGEIVNAIEDLPEKLRSCTILLNLEDFSYQQIAEILHVPIGTVKSRLHRGRKILRKKLVDVARDKGVLPEDEEVLLDAGPGD